MHANKHNTHTLPCSQTVSNRTQGSSECQTVTCRVAHSYSNPRTHTHTHVHIDIQLQQMETIYPQVVLFNWVVCSCLRLVPVNQFDTICASLRLRLRLLWPRVSSNLHQSLAQWALVKIGKQNSPSGPAWARQLRPKMIYERNFDNQLRFLFLFFFALLFQKAPKWKSNFEVHFHCTLWNSFMPWQRRRS